MGKGDSSYARVQRGSLLPVSVAPSTGERFKELVAHPLVMIEQILSSATPDGREYVQDHDEWVIVLSGGATVELGGEAAAGEAREAVSREGEAREATSEYRASSRHESGGAEVVDLRGGDWLFIPAGKSHRVTSTMAGTVWLAVHLHGGDETGREIGGDGSFST